MSLWNSMTESERSETLQNMRWKGGHFAGYIAQAWMQADSSNTRRLVEAFPDLIEKFQPKNWRRIDEDATSNN